MNSTSLGKTIYLGLGPALYLGFWIFCVSQTTNMAPKDSAVFLFTCLGLSILYLTMSLLTLKLHLVWNVPTIKKNGVYAAHAKFAWAYALMIGLPASLCSVLSVSTPPGEWQFTLFVAISKYLIGWFLGGCFGAFFGTFLLALLVPITTVLVKLIASPGTACK